MARHAIMLADCAAGAKRSRRGETALKCCRADALLSVLKRVLVLRGMGCGGGGGGAACLSSHCIRNIVYRVPAIKTLVETAAVVSRICVPM
jgi:hypothetical protein